MPRTFADRLAIASEKAELDDCEGDDEERIENRKKTDGEAADQQGHGKGTRSPQGTVDDGGGEAAAARRVDQVVEVTQGPFTDFSGTVQEVYSDKGKVKVEIALFGRPTSVELDYTDLKGY